MGTAPKEYGGQPHQKRQKGRYVVYRFYLAVSLLPLLYYFGACIFLSLPQMLVPPRGRGGAVLRVVMPVRSSSLRPACFSIARRVFGKTPSLSSGHLQARPLSLRRPSVESSERIEKRAPAAPLTAEHRDPSLARPPSHPHRLSEASRDNPLAENGTALSRQHLVISSAVKNPSSLLSALSKLLHLPEEEQQQPPPPSDGCHAFGTPYWTLAAKGDAIIRSCLFETEDRARLFCDRLAPVSDELDHHAHLDVSGPLADTGFTLVNVTCTTHSPPGLSMRDIRLANRIDDLARPLTVNKEVS